MMRSGPSTVGVVEAVRCGGRRRAPRRRTRLDETCRRETMSMVHVPLFPRGSAIFAPSAAHLAPSHGARQVSPASNATLPASFLNRRVAFNRIDRAATGGSKPLVQNQPLVRRAPAVRNNATVQDIVADVSFIARSGGSTGPAAVDNKRSSYNMTGPQLQLATNRLSNLVGEGYLQRLADGLTARLAAHSSLALRMLPRLVDMQPLAYLTLWALNCEAAVAVDTAANVSAVSGFPASSGLAVASARPEVTSAVLVRALLAYARDAAPWYRWPVPSGPNDAKTLRPSDLQDDARVGEDGFSIGGSGSDRSFLRTSVLHPNCHLACVVCGEVMHFTMMPAHLFGHMGAETFGSLPDPPAQGGGASSERGSGGPSGDGEHAGDIRQAKEVFFARACHGSDNGASHNNTVPPVVRCELCEDLGLNVLCDDARATESHGLLAQVLSSSNTSRHGNTVTASRTEAAASRAASLGNRAVTPPTAPWGVTVPASMSEHHLWWHINRERLYDEEGRPVLDPSAVARHSYLTDDATDPSANEDASSPEDEVAELWGFDVFTDAAERATRDTRDAAASRGSRRKGRPPAMAHAAGAGWWTVIPPPESVSIDPTCCSGDLESDLANASRDPAIMFQQLRRFEMERGMLEARHLRQPLHRHSVVPPSGFVPRSMPTKDSVASAAADLEVLHGPPAVAYRLESRRAARVRYYLSFDVAPLTSEYAARVGRRRVLPSRLSAARALADLDERLEIRTTWEAVSKLTNGGSKFVPRAKGGAGTLEEAGTAGSALPVQLRPVALMDRVVDLPAGYPIGEAQSALAHLRVCFSVLPRHVQHFYLAIASEDMMRGVAFFHLASLVHGVSTRTRNIQSPPSLSPSPIDEEVAAAARSLVRPAIPGEDRSEGAPAVLQAPVIAARMVPELRRHLRTTHTILIQEVSVLTRLAVALSLQYMLTRMYPENSLLDSHGKALSQLEPDQAQRVWARDHVLSRLSSNSDALAISVPQAEQTLRSCPSMRPYILSIPDTIRLASEALAEALTLPLLPHHTAYQPPSVAGQEKVMDADPDDEEAAAMRPPPVLATVEASLQWAAFGAETKAHIAEREKNLVPIMRYAVLPSIGTPHPDDVETDLEVPDEQELAHQRKTQAERLMAGERPADVVEKELYSSSRTRAEEAMLPVAEGAAGRFSAVLGGLASPALSALHQQRVAKRRRDGKMNLSEDPDAIDEMLDSRSSSVASRFRLVESASAFSQSQSGLSTNMRGDFAMLRENAYLAAVAGQDDGVADASIVASGLAGENPTQTAVDATRRRLREVAVLDALLPIPAAAVTGRPDRCTMAAAFGVPVTDGSAPKAGTSPSEKQFNPSQLLDERSTAALTSFGNEVARYRVLRRGVLSRVATEVHAFDLPKFASLSREKRQMAARAQEATADESGVDTSDLRTMDPELITVRATKHIMELAVPFHVPPPLEHTTADWPMLGYRAAVRLAPGESLPHDPLDVRFGAARDLAMAAGILNPDMGALAGEEMEVAKGDVLKSWEHRVVELTGPGTSSTPVGKIPMRFVALSSEFFSFVWPTNRINIMETEVLPSGWFTPGGTTSTGASSTICGIPVEVSSSALGGGHRGGAGSNAGARAVVSSTRVGEQSLVQRGVEMGYYLAASHGDATPRERDSRPPMHSAPLPWLDWPWRPGPFPSGIPAPVVRWSKKQMQGNSRQRDAAYFVLHPGVASAFDAFSSVQWEIDTGVLHAVRLAHAAEIDCSQLPIALSRISAPIEPEPSAAEEESADGTRQIIDRNQRREQERRQRKAKAAEFNLFREQVRQNLVCQNYLADVVDRAERQAESGPFYNVFTPDFRGRVYPMQPVLNHTGSDFIRGMFRFAERKPLGEDGIYWLKAHVGAMWGLDKSSFQDRVDFAETDQMMELARGMLHEPDDVGRMQKWLRQDKPFVCCQATLEYARALEHYSHYGSFESFESSVPVHADGSCNGFQHYTALTRDAKGAVFVNLVPSARPQDVYGGVVDHVKKTVEQIVATNVVPWWLHLPTVLQRVPVVREYVEEHGHRWEPLPPLIERQMTMAQLTQFRETHVGFLKDAHFLALHGLVVRKLLKQSIMTQVYGVTFRGAREQIERALKRLLQDQLQITVGVPGPSPELTVDFSRLTRISRLLAIATFRGVTEVFHGAIHAMTWLVDFAQAVSNVRHGQIPACITSPVGFPVVQPYLRDQERTVRTVFGTVRRKAEDAWTGRVNPQRQRQAFPPNFIHNLDATHCYMSAVDARMRGVTFASVHDSFWTHPSDYGRLAHILRSSFVRLHCTPWLDEQYRFGLE
eukprot:TRINITY_DN643_c0_g1_i3.p1 TRINITY_DN643_c0_g1~~TRINITY_DN643_c0_g1_i3.p1  ORF type:complete len:2303 (-),score=485.98 TRINITY_DN643_c0_g1_i3:797-7705(-)